MEAAPASLRSEGQPESGRRSAQSGEVFSDANRMPMKKIAVFGNAGGGKSTLARRLADQTYLPLYSLDAIQHPHGGPEIAREEYLRIHAEILQSNEWIIDGYGCRQSSWDRFACADTLIYVDLPLIKHFWWVTKRFLKGLFKTPEGWPEGSPMIRSTMSSYRVLWLCHQHLTPKYRELVAGKSTHTRIHHLRSESEIKTFLKAVTR